jgi:hypothetical protein
MHCISIGRCSAFRSGSALLLSFFVHCIIFFRQKSEHLGNHQNNFNRKTINHIMNCKTRKEKDKAVPASRALSISCSHVTRLARPARAHRSACSCPPPGGRRPAPIRQQSKSNSMNLKKNQIVCSK